MIPGLPAFSYWGEQPPGPFVLFARGHNRAPEDGGSLALEEMLHCRLGDKEHVGAQLLLWTLEDPLPHPSALSAKGECYPPIPAPHCGRLLVVLTHWCFSLRKCLQGASGAG